MAVITHIADAVVAELNAATFSQPFTAGRHYQPLFDLADMKVLHVTVVPNGVTVQPVSRSEIQHDYKIDIAPRKIQASHSIPEPSGIAWSPDGRALALLLDGQEIQTFDGTTARSQFRFPVNN